ncbi:unnamed protein product [Brachionus calyciflorus]|uniref:Uncharacterized protein n=1 Tax=Brachionus calyciflorus TaxID=104777 RepID=A0A813P8Y7_9BILA|nr:unnamed protein product [Brachionus calyciflorus]
MKKITIYLFSFLFFCGLINASLVDDEDESDEYSDENLEDKRYMTNVKSTNPWIRYKASFYSREETKDNMPASGLRAATLKESIKGLGLLQVSVDPKQIPLYSRFKVKLWDGWTIVPAIALDLGPTKLIDILVDNITEAINYGIKTVQVQIIEN